ncbi:hypothetical protein JCM8208_001145 [Rhodotorula glutinis]
MTSIDNVAIPSTAKLTATRNGLAVLIALLIRTRSATTHRNVFPGRETLDDWRRATVNALTEDWERVGADRSLFAKGLIWFNSKMQRGEVENVDEMPPLWVMQAWLASGHGLEHHWDERTGRWVDNPNEGSAGSTGPPKLLDPPYQGPPQPRDPILPVDWHNFRSLGSTPIAQLSYGAARHYRLDKQAWEEGHEQGRRC